jgi:hypothetical protein
MASRPPGRPRYVQHRRHRRHPVRRFIEKTRKSLGFVGVALALALVVAAIIAYAILPAADATFGFFTNEGPQMSHEQEQAMKRSKEQRQQKIEQSEKP